MTEAARGYLVRDADSTRGTGAKVDQIYPYTLRGLTEALEEARFRSHSGAPQVLAILGTGNTRVIRRFENGREVPVAPLAARLAVWIYRDPGCGHNLSRSSRPSWVSICVLIRMKRGHAPRFGATQWTMTGWQKTMSPGSPVSSTTRRGAPSTTVSWSMNSAMRSAGDGACPVSAISHG